MIGRQKPKAKSRSLTAIREGATGFGMTIGGAGRDGEGGESAQARVAVLQGRNKDGDVKSPLQGKGRCRAKARRYIYFSEPGQMLGRQRPKAKSRSLTAIRDNPYAPLTAGKHATGVGMTPGGSGPSKLGVNER
jgi:hypothetical protein